MGSRTPRADVNNGIDWNVLDSAVMESGDDLIVQWRIIGEFYEALELEAYPFDYQVLRINFAVNCKKGGPMPVIIDVPPDAISTVSEEGFHEHQEWDGCDHRRKRKKNTSNSYGDLLAKPYSFEADDREFPSLRLLVLLTRTNMVSRVFPPTRFR